MIDRVSAIMRLCDSTMAEDKRVNAERKQFQPKGPLEVVYAELF
jgi:hypothetical protein